MEWIGSQRIEDTLKDTQNTLKWMLSNLNKDKIPFKNGQQIIEIS